MGSPLDREDESALILFDGRCRPQKSLRCFLNLLTRDFGFRLTFNRLFWAADRAEQFRYTVSRLPRKLS